MTFRYRLDNKYSGDSCRSFSSAFLSRASLFLVLMTAAVCAPIAQATDKPATIDSVATANPVSQCNWINCFGDLNGMGRQHPDLLLANQLLASQSINMTLADAHAIHENEFLPVSATANGANAPSTIFKTERWRTNGAVIVSAIFAAAWLTADGITTASMSRGASETGSIWAYGRHPTPGRTAAMMAAEFVGVEASSYVLHKMKAPKWVYIAPMVVSGSLHASAAIPNMTIGQ
jgi:hypothetical protein